MRPFLSSRAAADTAVAWEPNADRMTASFSSNIESDMAQMIKAFLAAVGLANSGSSVAAQECGTLLQWTSDIACTCGYLVNSDRRLECYDSILVGLNEDGTLCDTFCDVNGDGMETESDKFYNPGDRLFALFDLETPAIVTSGEFVASCPGKWAASCSSSGRASILYHFSPCLGEDAPTKRIKCFDAARSKMLAELDEFDRQIEQMFRFQESREVFLEAARWAADPIECRDAYDMMLQCPDSDIEEMCQSLVESAVEDAEDGALEACEDRRYEPEPPSRW